MTEDQVVAIYGSIKTLAQGMAAREAALDKKTAALDAAIAELKQLPLTLGKQTGQYIGMGVRQAMEQDFSPPIQEVFQPPIAELKSVLRNARESIQEVSRYAKYQTLVWMFSLAGIGFVAGAGVTFLYLGSKIDTLREQVVAIQQQIAPASPVSSSGGPSKPAPKNGHSGSGVKPNRKAMQSRLRPPFPMQRSLPNERAGYEFAAQALGTRILPRLPQTHSLDYGLRFVNLTARYQHDSGSASSQKQS